MLLNTLIAISLMVGSFNVPEDISIKSRIEIAAINNQIDPEKMLELCRCESGFNPSAWNKEDPGIGSKGLFQYQTATFYETARKYGLESPDIWNVDHQIKLTAFLLAQNKWKLWYNCSKRIKMV